MVRKARKGRRVKISVTLSAEWLRPVDAFVKVHAGYNRSKVLDDALRLWCAHQQEQAMEAQFTAPQDEREREERAAWKRIQAAAAARLLKARSVEG